MCCFIPGQTHKCASAAGDTTIQTDTHTDIQTHTQKRLYKKELPPPFNGKCSQPLTGKRKLFTTFFLPNFCRMPSLRLQGRTRWAHAKQGKWRPSFWEFSSFLFRLFNTVAGRQTDTWHWQNAIVAARIYGWLFWRWRMERKWDPTDYFTFLEASKSAVDAFELSNFRIFEAL